MEEEEDKLTLILSRNPNLNGSLPVLNKEIIYDIDKDKYYLYNTKNNKNIHINFYGKKIPKINNAQVGQSSYNERLKNHSIEKINEKIDDSLYHPRMKNFDGFSQIPRPLIQPFSNLKISSENKNKLINSIKNNNSIFSLKKIKNLFNKKNNDKISGLEYYSGTISNIVNNKNKIKVSNSIDNEINTGNLNEKEIKCLKKFKKNILNNSVNMINGIKLSHPKDIFVNQFNINYNIMYEKPIKDLSQNKDLTININTYNKLYKIINNNPITCLKNKDNNNNNLCYDNFSYDYKDKKKYKLGRPKSVISIKSHVNKLISNNKINNIKNNKSIFFPEELELKKIESKRYDTEDDYFDIINQNHKNNNSNILSIKSHSMNEIITKNIHSLKDLEKHYKKEKKNLIGYKKPYIKKIPIIKQRIPKYKSTGELYKKEIDLFKLVNPQKLKEEEDEINKHNNYLKKKIEKDRYIQMVKYKHLINKNSRLNSAKYNIGKEYID